jgi:DNA-binding NtrC family response regulator
LTYPAALRAVVADFEEGFLRHHLTKNHGNITKTADSIGLSRVALHKKIKQYFIE